MDVPMKKALIYSDGGSRGNPGPSAIGYSIRDEEGEEIFACGRSMGLGTNNEAEYLALLEALQKAKELRIQEVKAFLDSELVVKQILGAYKVKSENLLTFHERIGKEIQGFTKFSIQHIPRSKNKRADQLVNQALDNPGTWVYENGEEKQVSTSGKSPSLLDDLETNSRRSRRPSEASGKKEDQAWRKGLFEIQSLLEEKGYGSVVLHRFERCVLFEADLEEQRRLYKEQDYWVRVLEKKGFLMGGLAFEKAICPQEEAQE